MKYRLMGNSGLRVSELALGTMTFGDSGWGADRRGSREVYERFREAGGNFIDTANVYGGAESEVFLGEFIAEDRERVVVSTKYTVPTRDGDANAAGNNRKNMMDSLHASLRRLGTDYIDLYWVHVRDFTTPIEEVMRGLDDVVRQGKVLYVGISDTPAWEVSRANTLAQLRGWTAFVGLQIRYSLLDRSAERDLLPMAKALDLTVTPWGVVGAGILTGKYNRDRSAKGRVADRDGLTERDLAIAAEVVKVADELGRTPVQVALNWVRQGEGVIVPVVGARDREQLDENLGCLDFELSSEVMQRLDDVSHIELGFPHDFLREHRLPGRVIDHRAR